MCCDVKIFGEQTRIFECGGGLNRCFSKVVASDHSRMYSSGAGGSLLPQRGCCNRGRVFQNEDSAKS